METALAPAKPSVRIVGTSHVAHESTLRIKKAAVEFQPTHIAVELDRQRLLALRDRAKDPASARKRPPLSLAKQVGMTGYLFLLIAGWVQRKAGDILKVEPGLDMLAAVLLARDSKLPLALVDQDVRVTLKRISTLFTRREKFRLLGDILTAPFSKRNKELAKRVRLDRVPSDKVVKELLKELETRYPGLHRALVTERNIYMCTRVDAIARANPGARILLVIGAAHQEDIEKRMKAIGTVDVK